MLRKSWIQYLGIEIKTAFKLIMHRLDIECFGIKYKKKQKFGKTYGKI